MVARRPAGSTTCSASVYVVGAAPSSVASTAPGWSDVHATVPSDAVIVQVQRVPTAPRTSGTSWTGRPSTTGSGRAWTSSITGPPCTALVGAVGADRPSRVGATVVQSVSP